MKRFVVLTLPLVSGWFSLHPLPATAQSTAEARSAASVPVGQMAARVGDVIIDGALDEPEWQRVAAHNGFVATEPVEGVPALHDTDVFLLYDEDAVYVGAVMHDPEPERIFRQLTRRGEIAEAVDYFEVSLDSDFDRRTAYRFRISAAGVQVDSYRFNDTLIDESWDGIWESAVQIGADRWTAELRIPLSQIRYRPSTEPQVWGANFARRRNANGETSFWALESRVDYGGVSVFGELHGIVLPEATRALEARPYALARRRTARADAGNPFFSGTDQAFNAGADIRYGLGSTFVLNLTLNPDFGQVEVDPAVINLTANETFYPELRPFFTSDDRIFQFALSGGQNNLFYSRRIGRAPQGTGPGDATFLDLPSETTILGAGKITGRTQRGLSLGVLGAVTRAEKGSAFFPAEDRFQEFDAEPATAYGVLRAQQELRGGASYVAGILTMARRDLPEDRSLDWLTSNALSTGVAFEHTWNTRAWALWGFLAGSYVEGSTNAITRIQMSPAHYLQRPDGPDYLGVDSTATSLTGAEWRLQLERRSGRHWTGAIWAAEVTPTFEINDLGFSQTPERLDGGIRLSYQEINPGRVLRSYRFTGMTFQNFRHEALDDPFSWSGWGHAHKAGRFGLDTNLTFLNYWSTDIGIGFVPELFNDVATRGGPLMLQPATTNLTLRLSNDPRSNLRVTPSINLSRNPVGSYGRTFGVTLGWRPTSAIELSATPEYQVQRDAAQYVTATGNVGFAPTLGARYIFADLDRQNLAMPLRLNWIFSPTLTLQLFAQPLLSSGDFITYKQLANVESFDFEVFEEGTAIGGVAGMTCVGGRTCVSNGRRFVDFTGNGSTDISFVDRDFNQRSLRGNVVLRWEYRPGSTLYLVWQQNRLDRQNIGDFRFGRDTEALFDTQPENTLIVKASYWLGI